MINKLKIDIEVIIREYSNYVFRVVDNAVGNSLSYEDKEEIVSDTFYLLWKNQDKIETNLKSYLATIAKNCSYQRLNKIKDNLQYDETTNAYNMDYEDNIYIGEILKVLNDGEKNIFNLYYVNGYKVKEIAKLINKSVSNIKIILYRIRKKLKEVR